MAEVQQILIVVWDTIVMMGMDGYLIAAVVISLVVFVIRMILRG
jgi:hypothetical protein